jgi:hypothetical protein
MEEDLEYRSLRDIVIYIVYCEDIRDINFDTMTVDRFIRLFNEGKFQNGKHILLGDKDVAQAMCRVSHE